MKATAGATTKATKVSDCAAAVDVMVGPGDGVTGYKRCDVSIHRTSAGGLHVDIEVPAPLAGSVGSFLAALGVKGQR
jgi:hypothetical protein